MKYQNRYHKTTKVIRINLGDYAWVKEISQRANVSIAEALHLIITEQSNREQVTMVPRIQMPMAMPSPIIAVNGSKAAAFMSKPKGVRYE